MKHLITFRTEFRGCTTYGMVTADDLIEWLAEMQKEPETYILLNSQLVTDEQAKKYEGTFKSMWK
jgi:hypothetical protein